LRLIENIDGSEELQRPCAASSPTETSAEHNDLYLAHGIEMGQQTVQLKHKTNLIPPVLGKTHTVAEILASECHNPSVRSIQRSKELEKSGLAGTRMPGQPRMSPGRWSLSEGLRAPARCDRNPPWRWLR